MFDFGFRSVTTSTTEGLDGAALKKVKCFDSRERLWTFVERDGELVFCNIQKNEYLEGWVDIFFTNALYPHVEIKKPMAPGSIGYTYSDLGLDDPDLAFASYTDTSCPLD